MFGPTSNVSFACVRASLWQELARPAWCQGASPEGKIFWDCLQKHNPEYAAELVAGKKTMESAEQELSIALKHLTGQCALQCLSTAPWSNALLPCKPGPKLWWKMQKA